MARKLQEEPEVALAYDHIAAQYDGDYLHHKDIAENILVRKLLLEKGVLSGRVLDAGSGTGFLLDQIPVPAAQYLGVEISPGMISIAKRKHPGHEFILGDMLDMRAVPAGSVDFIVSLFGCVNYCQNLRDVFSEAFRVLRPGGQVFFMIGTPRHVRRGVYCLAEFDVPRWFFTPKQVRREMLPWFDSVQVQGMSMLVDYLPEFLPQVCHTTWLRLECATAGRLLPQACFYLLATGVKLEGGHGSKATRD